MTAPVPLADPGSAPARFLAQGLTGALLGAAAASTAYSLLTRGGRARPGAVRVVVPDAPDTGATPRAPVAPPALDASKVSAAPDTPGAPATPGSSGTPEAPDVWLRTNFRGRRVTLRQGPALACGVCAAVLLVPGPGPRVRAASALAAAGAAAFGVYDDLAGSSRARGLRGHLGALASGRVTTGMVKMAGIGATGVAAARLLRRSPLDTVLDSALIAASANLLNLFDLRPGRAAKVALFAAAPALASPAAPLLGPVVGASAALLPDELAERSMLGDAGANALGAALGAAAAARAPRPVRAALLAGVAALTLASERVSFSRVIDRVPALRRLDLWGRHE
ncbi:hypothetical protein [Nocardiopsis sp. RV163]|uniref:hypothetical protein n=1 Tax=Nocardiopsis sp. RV163 TaxID=1661388 RepID=UPI000AB4A4B6|nr:hypothetical protein [Nocardiopsis sp. RV163]